MAAAQDPEVKAFPLEPLPKSMKAVVFDRFADETKDFEEEIKAIVQIEHKQPLPELEPHQVLVKVHAASINPVDWKILKGNLALVVKSPPLVPGFDLAGTVIRLGTKTKRLRLGDHVYGMTFVKDLGTFAEYVAVSERVLSIKPASLTFAQAATMPLAALTSYQAVVESGRLAKDQKVLVLGGSGGTGYFGLQIARHYGASTVACTCSASNAELVKAAGATVVIDYHSQNWWDELAGQEFDLIYDTVGGQESWDNAKLVLKPKTGRFVTIAGDRQGKLNIPNLVKTGASIANRKFWSLLGYTNYDYVMTKSRHDHLDVLTKMVDDGALVPFVETVYPLEDAAKFYLHSYRGRTKCKIALSVDDQAGEK